MYTKIALAVISVLAVVLFAWLLVEKSRNTDLNSRLDQLQRTVTAAENDLTEARLKSAQTDRDLTQVKRSLAQSEMDKSNLTAELQRTKSSLETEKSKSRAAEDDLAALKKIESEAGTTKSNLEAAQKRLKELESLASEATGLRQALAEAESRAAAARQSSEWAIRDEEVEKLVNAGSPETAKTPLAAVPDDQAARIRDLEARLAECESGRTPTSSDAARDAGSENEEAPAPATEEQNESAEKLSQAEARGKIQAAENQAEHWRRELEKAGSANRDADNALTALRAQLAEMTRERDRLLAEQKETQTSAANYDRLVNDLKAQLETREITISNLKDEMALTFLDSVFFAPGRDAVTPDGALALDRVAAVLKSLNYSRLMVVGHTDDQPIVKSYRKAFPTNWELSSARAVAVTRYLTEKGGVPPEGLTAAGRSSYDPQGPNDSEENRRRNRRVEIIISSGQAEDRP